MPGRFVNCCQLLRFLNDHDRVIFEDGTFPFLNPARLIFILGKNFERFRRPPRGKGFREKRRGGKGVKYHFDVCLFIQQVGRD